MIVDLTEWDSAYGIPLDGYLFGIRRFAKAGDNGFRTRLFGIPVVVLRGGVAARFFYEGGRFTRTAALPPSVTRLLQDAGSVQNLEGASHRHRKALFVTALTDPATADSMMEILAKEWATASTGWEEAEVVVLADEIPRILARTVFAWAGITVSPAEADRRGKQLRSMIDNAGRIGPANWIARARRLSTEKWVRHLILDARAEPAAPEASLLHAFAGHTDDDGFLLPTETVAVEVINVLRPFVAISRFILFAALALRRRPDLADRFAAGDETMLEAFAQEVRRFYPFFPLIAGRATQDVDYDAHHFAPGDLVMLDLYGTDHDPALWGDPEVFRPERFVEMGVDPNHLIAQGGGTYLDGHRCPGEPLTVTTIMQAARLLTQTITYDVPAQDLRVNLRAFPAAPRSGFRIGNVNRTGLTSD